MKNYLKNNYYHTVKNTLGGGELGSKPVEPCFLSSNIIVCFCLLMLRR